MVPALGARLRLGLRLRSAIQAAHGLGGPRSLDEMSSDSRSLTRYVPAPMRVLFGAELDWKFVTVVAVAFASLVVVGCKSQQEASRPPEPAFKTKPAGSQTNLVIAPANSPVGKIASVNRQAKFAVISFPVAQMPANNTRLAIFRAGARVGEVKISGPAQGTFTVGDIIAGSAQEGDEVWAE